MESALVKKAFDFAMEAHKNQKRKGSKEDIPYISHVLGVVSIAIELSGDEVTATASLLHDVVEDIKAVTIDVIRAEFGDEVADVVAALTENKKLSWDERKIFARNHVPELDDRAFIAKSSDVLHNTLGIVTDFDIMNWDYFKKGISTTLENYSLILSALITEAKANRQHLSPKVLHRLLFAADGIADCRSKAERLERLEQMQERKGIFISGDRLSRADFLEKYGLHIGEDVDDPSLKFVTPPDDEDNHLFEIRTSRMLLPIDVDFGQEKPLVRDFCSTPMAFSTINGCDFVVIGCSELPNNEIRYLPLSDEDLAAFRVKIFKSPHLKLPVETTLDNLEVWVVQNLAHTIEFLTIMYQGEVA